MEPAGPARVERRLAAPSRAVLRLGTEFLPAPSARRVLCGSSSGEPDGPSRKTPGREYITAYVVMCSQAMVHQ
jgi:hypothetical protein